MIKDGIRGILIGLFKTLVYLLCILPALSLFYKPFPDSLSTISPFLVSKIPSPPLR